MQIFLSYSHDDVDFAKYVASALNAAGVNVWFDRERMIAGADNLDLIRSAARASDHAVFLVSRSWLTKDWTRKELALFESRDARTTRRIPVVRTRLRDIRDELPPALSERSAIEWLLEDPEPEARLWQLYCAVHGCECGLEREWVERGRGLLAGAPARLSPPVPPARALHLASVFCGRAEQWAQLGQLMRQKACHLVLLPGARGQAHDVFVKRIQQEAQNAQILYVRWEQRPSSEEEFREMLARALGVHAGALAAELTSQAGHRGLLLVHDSVSGDYDDPEIVNYYGTYMPRLLEDARPPLPVQCLQPVEWLEPSLLARIAGFFDRGHPSQDRGRALALLDRLVRLRETPYRAVALPELPTITPQEIVRACEPYDFDADAIELLLKRVAAGARTSSDMLAMLDDFVRDRQRPRKESHAARLRVATVQG